MRQKSKPRSFNQRIGVEIYPPGQDIEILENPATLSGEKVLPGFVLDLTSIFHP